ncbi:MAG: DUF4173 domain-containing protein [Clostridiales bacterium]|nr:DUF4173 domain-containing protein [Clostridiales bacterium]
MDNKVTLQRLGILLAYPLAYAYIRLMMDFNNTFVVDPSGGAGHLQISAAYPLFALVFIVVNELVRRGRRGNEMPSPETVFWYGITFMAGLTACFGPNVLLSLFGMHLSAVYSVLISNDVLIGKRTSGFLPADLLSGFCIRPFVGFPNVVLDWRSFGKSSQGDNISGSRIKSIVGGIVFTIIMGSLLLMSIAFMAMIDEDLRNVISSMLDGFFGYLCFKTVIEIIFRMILAVPVCFYLYGLISRSASSDGENEGKIAAVLNKARAKGKTVSSMLVYIAAGVFVAAYALFFVKRLMYMIGGFTGTVPEGMLVSHYAREGFFELVGIMAVNMCVYLAIILLGKTDEDGKFSKAARILVTALMSESIVFAVVAMSKLGLYYSIYGYTPMRILAMWGTLALGFASGMTILTVNRSKTHIRAGIIFTAVSYIAICVLSGILEALS